MSSKLGLLLSILTFFWEHLLLGCRYMPREGDVPNEAVTPDLPYHISTTLLMIDFSWLGLVPRPKPNTVCCSTQATISGPCSAPEPTQEVAHRTLEA